MPIVTYKDTYYYEYRFKTSFEETNLVGNIYFANFVVWQGKCREMFLYEYCPDIVDRINEGLALITLDLSVQFRSQLFAFDTVVMHMSLNAQSSSRLIMATAAMREVNGKMIAVSYPDSIFQVFEDYGVSTV